MRTNKDRSVVLIENPLTGNDAFASALGLTESIGAEKHISPNEARSIYGRDAWSSAQKVILIRDPRERFESAMILAFLNKGSEQFTDEFNLHLIENESKKPQERATELIAFVRDNIGLVPQFFLPQTHWLTAKFDLILASRDIAEYFNKVIGKCCLKKNSLRSNPQYRSFRGKSDLSLVKEVYAEDYELFSRLKVWSPDPMSVRLVEGYCKRCMANEGKFSELISGVELTDTNEAIEASSNSENSAEEPILHVRAKRKRSKKSTIDSELTVIDTDSVEE
jgi:hypothetical protein